MLTGVIAVQLLALYVLLNGGGWLFDDNLYLELAQKYGFSRAWLMNSNFGHWGIAHHAIFSIQNHLMPLDYRWALVGMLLLVGASIFLLERILSMLLGVGWMPLVAAACFGISILFVRALQWWVFGLQSIPTVFCDLLCLYAYLRYQEDSSPRWIVVSAGAMAVGLLFYEKPAFLPLYIGLIRVLFLTADLRPRALWGAIWRERRMWFAYAAVLVVWAIGFKASGAGLSSPRSPTALQWLQFFRVGWAETLVPAMFGLMFPQSGPIIQSEPNALQIGVIIVLQLAVIAAVAVSVRRKRSAWRAWACLGVFVVVSGVLTGLARIGQFGPGVAGDLRYWIDFSWLVPLLVCVAFSRRTVFTPQTPSQSASMPRPRPVVAFAVGVVMLGYLAASVATGAKLETEWPAHAARVWETNLEHGLAAAHRRAAPPVLADNVVPFYIIEAAFAPLNQLSSIALHYGPHVQIDGPLTGQLLVVDAAGNVRPAHVARIVYSAPVNRCLSAGGAALGLVRRVPPLSTVAGSFYLLVSYSSAQATTLTLGVESAVSVPTVAGMSVPLTPVAHSSIAWLGPAPPSLLTLGLLPHMTVCLRHLEVVTLAPE